MMQIHEYISIHIYHYIHLCLCLLSYTHIHIYVYINSSSVQMAHYQRDLFWPPFINYYSSLLRYLLSLFTCFIFLHDTNHHLNIMKHYVFTVCIFYYGVTSTRGENFFLSWSMLYLEQKLDLDMFSIHSLKEWTFNGCLFCVGTVLFVLHTASHVLV